MAQSRRTPAMLPGRCSLELSDRKLQRKIKSHKLCAERVTDYRVTQRSMARSRRACPERSRRNREDAYLTHAARSFSTTEIRTWLRSELDTFLIFLIVCGRKAPNSICQHASPGSFDSAP